MGHFRSGDGAGSCGMGWYRYPMHVRALLTHSLGLTHQPTSGPLQSCMVTWAGLDPSNYQGQRRSQGGFLWYLGTPPLGQIEGPLTKIVDGFLELAGSLHTSSISL